ncbi:division/cell wall cluster transcriptional repressor MraZ [bacterium]|nr:MAG: division/cell wall cluster transcriptional repressor MraZ [bacterium]
MGKDFVFLWGELGQIVAYPKATWDGMVNELAAFGANNFHLQQYIRLFFSHAAVGVNTDGQGRAVIPSRLRELAKLDGPLTVVGGMFRVEIWARDEYDASQNEPDEYNRARRESIERAYAKLRGESVKGEA